MSKNLRKCKKTMHLFCCAENKKLKKSVLEEMSENECFFDAMYEIVNNIYLKNMKLSKLTPAQKKQAKKLLPILRKIHKRPKKKIIKRKVILQSGGFINFILPILTTIVSELISDAISKKSDSGST